MVGIVAPAIDVKPGQPEVYYFDHPTRERVIAKRKAVVEVTPARKPAKATKKTTKKG